ncbi:hypothetical protein PanWU01x14_058860, partial [Parasponia andersonii]
SIFIRSKPRPQTKSASHLAQSKDLPHLSIDLIEPSSKRTLSPSTLSLNSPSFVPFQQLLFLSPTSLWRSKTHLTNQLEMAHKHVEHVGSRWRCKNKTSQLGLLGSASPRNTRRSRRLLEIEVREDKDLALIEGMGKLGKRHHIAWSKEEKESAL